jgi:hypothetical protein
MLVVVELEYTYQELDEDSTLQIGHVPRCFSESSITVAACTAVSAVSQ